MSLPGTGLGYRTSKSGCAVALAGLVGLAAAAGVVIREVMS